MQEERRYRNIPVYQHNTTPTTKRRKSADDELEFAEKQISNSYSVFYMKLYND